MTRTDIQCQNRVIVFNDWDQSTHQVGTSDISSLVNILNFNPGKSNLTFSFTGNRHLKTSVLNFILSDEKGNQTLANGKVRPDYFSNGLLRLQQHLRWGCPRYQLLLRHQTFSYIFKVPLTCTTTVDDLDQPYKYRANQTGLPRELVSGRFVSVWFQK